MFVEQKHLALTPHWLPSQEAFPRYYSMCLCGGAVEQAPVFLKVISGIERLKMYQVIDFWKVSALTSPCM